MNDVYIKFSGTEREGTVAVGSYLVDAAGRLGVDLGCGCNSEESDELCKVKILKGVTLLSKPTSFEIEHLGEADRKDRQRLACQTRIEKSGEIELMTVKKETSENKKKDEGKNKTEGFKDEFRDLPLGEKISSLVELEMMALGDTVSYVMNSPYEAFGKVMDVMAGFGLDLEKKDREAKVPEEHTDGEKDSKASGVKNGRKKSSAATAKKSGSSKTAASKRTRKRRKPVKKDEEEKG